MNLVKGVADRVVSVSEGLRWKQQFFLGVLGVELPQSTNSGNIFLNPDYIAMFNRSMVMTQSLSTMGIFPEVERPRSVLYQFPLPLLDFNVTLNPFDLVRKVDNYYYVFPPYFYNYEIRALIDQLQVQRSMTR